MRVMSTRTARPSIRSATAACHPPVKAVGVQPVHGVGDHLLAGRRRGHRFAPARFIVTFWLVHSPVRVSEVVQAGQYDQQLLCRYQRTAGGEWTRQGRHACSFGPFTQPPRLQMHGGHAVGGLRPGVRGPTASGTSSPKPGPAHRLTSRRWRA